MSKPAMSRPIYAGFTSLVGWPSMSRRLVLSLSALLFGISLVCRA